MLASRPWLLLLANDPCADFNPLSLFLTIFIHTQLVVFLTPRCDLKHASAAILKTFIEKEKNTSWRLQDSWKLQFIIHRLNWRYTVVTLRKQNMKHPGNIYFLWCLSILDFLSSSFLQSQYSPQASLQSLCHGVQLGPHVRLRRGLHLCPLDCGVQVSARCYEWKRFLTEKIWKWPGRPSPHSLVTPINELSCKQMSQNIGKQWRLIITAVPQSINNGVKIEQLLTSFPECHLNCSWSFIAYFAFHNCQTWGKPSLVPQTLLINSKRAIIYQLPASHLSLIKR